MQTELFVLNEIVQSFALPEETYTVLATKTGYKYIDYQYSHSDGRIFEIAGPSVEWCRNKKQSWLLATEQGIPV